MNITASVSAQTCNWSTVHNCIKCGKIVRKSGDTLESFLQAMDEMRRTICAKCANPAKPRRKKA